MKKGELKSLNKKLAVAEAVSEARKNALLVILSTPAIAEFLKKNDPKALEMADRAVRAVKAGIAPGSGRLVEVAIGTPLCSDPTSETYWSM